MPRQNLPEMSDERREKLLEGYGTMIYRHDTSPGPRLTEEEYARNRKELGPDEPKTE